MRLIDSCIGAQCNPTCPGQLLFVDPGSAWGLTVETTILALSLVITVLCVGLKAAFIFHHCYLGRKQKHFLGESESSLVEREVGVHLYEVFSILLSSFSLILKGISAIETS